MNIYILRHAIAVERGTIGYEDDSLRPLTEQGINKMQQIALGMKALGLSFDLILSSPYLRAQETALLVAKAFNIKSSSIVSSKSLFPEIPFKGLLIEINEYKSINSVLLVGHEPHLSELISFLLMGTKTLPLNLKKGGLCHLSADFPVKPGSAHLHSLLSPAQLRRIR